jgi:hypothetical protein
LKSYYLLQFSKVSKASDNQDNRSRGPCSGEVAPSEGDSGEVAPSEGDSGEVAPSEGDSGEVAPAKLLRRSSLIDDVIISSVIISSYLL